MSKICFAHFVNNNYGLHCDDPAKKDTPYGDFANDMLHDKFFPWRHSLKPQKLMEYHEVVLEHIKSNGACDAAIATFEELFGMYIVSDYMEQWREKQVPCEEQPITFSSDIKMLDLSTRSYNCLCRTGKYKTVQQLVDAYWDETQPLLNVRNLGRKGVEEIQTRLAELGFIH